MNHQLPDPQNSRDFIESSLPWRRAWYVLRSNWPQFLYISLALIAIPQIVMEWVFGMRSWHFGETFGSHPITSVQSLLEPTRSFFVDYLGTTFLSLTLGITAYFSAILITVSSLSCTPKKLPEALYGGLRYLFFRGLLGFLLLSMGALLVLQIVVFIPLLAFVIELLVLILGVLCTAWPSLLVIERGTPLAAIKNAVSMSYAKDTQGGFWNSFFILASYQVALLALLSGISKAEGGLTNLDQWLQFQRNLWFFPSDFWPFGTTHAITSVLAWVSRGMVWTIYAVFVTSFVFQKLNQKNPNASSQDVPTSMG